MGWSQPRGKSCCPRRVQQQHQIKRWVFVSYLLRHVFGYAVVVSPHLDNSRLTATKEPCRIGLATLDFNESLKFSINHVYSLLVVKIVCKYFNSPSVQYNTPYRFILLASNSHGVKYVS